MITWLLSWPRHWWATIVYVYGTDEQTASDRITARTGWPKR